MSLWGVFDILDCFLALDDVCVCLKLHNVREKGVDREELPSWLLGHFLLSVQELLPSFWWKLV